MNLSTIVSRKTLLLGAAITLTVGAPALAVGVVASGKAVAPYVERLTRDLPTLAPSAPQVVVWEGADLDGDGAADVANPTGHAPRGHDAFGDGHFGASRDGGVREHAGVDYVAEAGQAVKAPISGFVSKIGYAYADDASLRYVEIDNPALSVTARVFYVDPSVEVGQVVRLGAAIGAAQDLQPRYAGITEHVHLEVADRNGRKLDAANLLHARFKGGSRLAELRRAASGG